LEETNERLVDIKRTFELVTNEKNTLEMNELKAKKLLTQLNEKAKSDIEKAKR
jgi:hypothetical protein